MHAFACLYTALHSTADFGAFCAQVGLRGCVERVHKHARHGGMSWRGRGRQAIRQVATSTAISASIFQPERPKPTSTASPTLTSRDDFATNFCYWNQMRDSAQGHVLQLVEAFLSRSATYKPTHAFARLGSRSSFLRSTLTHPPTSRQVPAGMQGRHPPRPLLPGNSEAATRGCTTTSTSWTARGR